MGTVIKGRFMSAEKGWPCRLESGMGETLGHARSTINLFLPRCFGDRSYRRSRSDKLALPAIERLEQRTAVSRPA